MRAVAYDALNADERGGTTLNGKPSFTIDQAADQLTRAGRSWSSDLGQAATVTYAFRATAPAEIPADAHGFQRFGDRQIAAAEQALTRWAEVANIRFVRVNPTGYSDDATILFGNYTSGADDSTAFAVLPGNAAATSATGDVWVNITDSPNNNVLLGDTADYGFLTLLHEIGHAIGLLHPSDYDSDDATDPTYAGSASYGQDSIEYTVMSYFDAEDTGARIPRYGLVPGGPLIDDIAAAQRLYGANYATNAGDTVYGYNPGSPSAAGRPATYLQSRDGTQPVWGTIWDGGGIDTLNFALSDYDQKIDLRAGSFSNVYGGIGTLSIAPGVTIENAFGGFYNDTLIGNDAANSLRGYAGNDRLYGGAGNDTLTGDSDSDLLDGGPGIDRATYYDFRQRYGVAMSAGAGTVDGGEYALGPEPGTDTLVSVETISFRDGTLTFDPDSASAKVSRLYDSVLGRQPDPAGNDRWVDAIEDGGRSLLSVTDAFLHSAEFLAATGNLSTPGFVDFLYNRVLHRAADPAGRDNWIFALDHGADRAAILSGFSESQEHRNITAANDARGYFVAVDAYEAVALLYDSLGRQPDYGGLIAWSESIRAGTTVAQVATAFAASAEFRNNTAALDNGGFVDYLYTTTLDRLPDPGGRAAWVGALNGGATRGDLLFAFSQSDEHFNMLAGSFVDGIDLVV
ncbi:DUF4214 domain-containing protein [Sphingomonas profundi]|uniref:DUF4214 domain-containing protein n=1 Tax=Alterirhizorhabdus profundi TaxID=2681549 RepID=UPI0018D0C6BF|nr:DUF4214 domain-containing protein [Sphingomonas profundi]